MKIEKLSTSRIEQYLRCPKEYYYDRHSSKEASDLIDEENLHKGTIIHEALEKLRYKPQKNLISDFLNEANENCEEYTLSPSETKEIIDLLKNWIETRDLGYEILDVEKYFKIPVKDFHLTGKIDVIERVDDNYLRVTDYKTGSSYKSMSDLKDNTQLKLYSLATMEIYDVENVEVSLDQIRFESPEYIQYSRDELVDFLQYVVSLRNKMKDDEIWRPKPGYQCAWCAYHEHCPAIQRTLDELEIDGFDYEELGKKYNQVHGKIKVLENKKKQLKKMMVNKMDKEGKEEYKSDDIAITKHQNQYTNYDPKTVVETVSNDSLSDVLKVKNSKISDLDLSQEQRDKLEMSKNISYSSSYVRVNEKE